jgi:hypothetical protein
LKFDAKILQGRLGNGGIPTGIAVIAALTPPTMLREKLALPRVRQLVNDEIFAELAFSLRKNKCARLAAPARAVQCTSAPKSFR